MIAIFKTRLIHLRKHIFSFIFWLILPILATLFVIYLTDKLQEDSKIPIGIVLEEDSALSNDLYEVIQENPLIRVYDVTEAEARIKVESHELDSAFVIQKDYEENILEGKRNRLITSYRSDMSFAYIPVSEMIISYVQQETGRAKTALTVMNLSENRANTWTADEIIAKSKEIQEEENLLRTSFSYQKTHQSVDEEKESLLNNWMLWAIFSVLSTLLVSDWIIKERKAAIAVRYAFMKYSLKSYMLQNLLLYTCAFFLMDLLAVFIFHFLLDEPISLQLILSLIVFRITVNLGSFLFALLFRNIYFYYVISFIISLILAILSGIIIPIEGNVTMLNPIHAFSQHSLLNPWLFVFILITVIWIMKGESDA
ncbi:ABC transporter permease [Oceanobacillus bengalensis]|uniref:ABC transporter permease n=1 Tax=Oceanobacillus bengalensis TaxID=1435466 RepID=A0A494YRI7_9BACI|nr:ABC transporter permease [Oceanobacillus bengalensis]RKQ12088.1 ABC transporter permease [Oceanobacillus bengalensis]